MAQWKSKSGVKEPSKKHLNSYLFKDRAELEKAKAATISHVQGRVTKKISVIEDVLEREGIMRGRRRERTDGEWWRDGLGVVCILDTQQDAVMDRDGTQEN